MLAEDLIKLLETHIGEDVKIVTYTCTEYGNEYFNTCEITGIENGHIQYQVESSEEVRYDIYDEPPYEDEPEWCPPEDELERLEELRYMCENESIQESESVDLDELNDELEEALNNGQEKS